MKLLVHWLILAAAIFFTPYVVHGITVNSFLTAVIVAAALAFINLTIKPIIKILTLPINILTLGIFSLVLNGFFFWILARLITGFDILTFVDAIIGALIVSILNWLANKILQDKD